MPTTRWNKTKTPVNSDAWNLTADLASLADGAAVTIAVASQSEQDGLAALAPGGVLPVPTVIFRTDLAEMRVWDGSKWGSSYNLAPPTPVGGLPTSGTFTLTPTLGRTIVNMRIWLTRTADASVSASPSFTTIGVAIPTQAIDAATAQDFYTTGVFSGSGMNANCHVYVNPATGSIAYRVQSNLTWSNGASLFLNGTWTVPRQ